MLLGDFCMDPSGHILALTNDNNIAKFYMTCAGDSPVKSVTDNILSKINDVQDELLIALTDPSVQSTCAQSLTTTMTHMSNTLEDDLLAPIVECKSLNQIYTDFVLDALCTSCASSMYNMWVLQFVIGLLLYFLICFADAVYHTYVIVDNEKGYLTVRRFNQVGNQDLYTALYIIFISVYIYLC